MTVSALEEYIIDKANDDMNMAMGIKTALERYISERLEFLDIYVRWIILKVRQRNMGCLLPDTQTAKK